uniref:Uncharacterized protein n=1 Tax=Romanomermis culicivorax TaxID=13658 RepID=A0A915JEL6_ROMCU
ELIGADKVEVTEEGFYKKYVPKTDFELAVRKAERRAEKLKSGVEDSYNSASVTWFNEAGGPSRKVDKFKISYVDSDQKTSGFVKLRPGYTMRGRNDVNVKYLVIYGVIEVTRDGEVSVKSPQSGYFIIDGIVPNSANFTPGCRRSRRRRVEAMPGGAKLIYKFTENGQRSEYTIINLDKRPHNEAYFHFMHCF